VRRIGSAILRKDRGPRRPQFAFMGYTTVMGGGTVSDRLACRLKTAGWFAPYRSVMPLEYCRASSGGEYGGAASLRRRTRSDNKRGSGTSFIQITATTGLGLIFPDHCGWPSSFLSPADGKVRLRIPSWFGCPGGVISGTFVSR